MRERERRKRRRGWERNTSCEVVFWANGGNEWKERTKHRTQEVVVEVK